MCIGQMLVLNSVSYSQIPVKDQSSPQTLEHPCLLLQEVERGGRVEEEDMARLMQQLEGRVGTEVRVQTQSELLFSWASNTPAVGSFLMFLSHNFSYFLEYN